MPQCRGVDTLSRSSSHWAGERVGGREFFLGSQHTRRAEGAHCGAREIGRGSKCCSLSVRSALDVHATKLPEVSEGVCRLSSLLCHWVGERCRGIRVFRGLHHICTGGWTRGGAEEDTHTAGAASDGRAWDAVLHFARRSLEPADQRACTTCWASERGYIEIGYSSPDRSPEE